MPLHIIGASDWHNQVCKPFINRLYKGQAATADNTAGNLPITSTTGGTQIPTMSSAGNKLVWPLRVACKSVKLLKANMTVAPAFVKLLG